MILPYVAEHSQFRKYPMTGMLVFLNVFVFLLFFAGQISERMSASPMLKNESLALSGQIYWQYLQSLSPTEQKQKPAWINSMQSKDVGQMEVLGAFALRDADFLSKIETVTAYGDDVALQGWREAAVQFRKQYFEQTLYHFGLSSLQNGPASWVTYQFSHAGAIHLFSNLLFLVVIGAAVEAGFGSLTLLVVYLLGGFAGGAGFLMTNAHGVIPMVGASASVSALLAFYCLAEARRRIRYVYFISPMPEHYGYIYLPTLLIIPLFLLVDLSSLLSTPEGLGSGVAYSAHLGGSIFGFAAAGLWRLKKYLTMNSAVQD